MKENKGITLISLIVTMVVMAVILVITVATIKKDNNTVKETKSSMKIYELQEIQQVVFENYIKYIQTKNEDYLAGTKCTSASELTEYETELGITFKEKSEYGNYFFLDSSEDLEKLGISNTKDKFIVNYKTGEVLNYTTKKTSDGEVLYIKGIE